MPTAQSSLFLETTAKDITNPNNIYTVTGRPSVAKPNIGELQISAMEWDEHSWFQKDILLSFTGSFTSGQRCLHYHPGHLRNYASAVIAFASFVGKLAVIGNAGVGLFKKNLRSNVSELARTAVAMKATKRGFDVRDDWSDVASNLDDATLYRDEGYYDIESQKLKIKGKIHRTNVYARGV